MKLIIVAALIVFLAAIPAGAGNYGGYGNYYRPMYYQPTYSYYPQSYASYSYIQQAVNLYDGGYHLHTEGYDSAGRYYPSGYYSWQKGLWYGANGQPYYQMSSAEYKAANAKAEFAPGWQKQLLDIAAARDKVEGRMRLN